MTTMIDNKTAWLIFQHADKVYETLVAIRDMAAEDIRTDETGASTFQIEADARAMIGMITGDATKQTEVDNDTET